MDGFEAYVAARGPMLLRLAVMLSGNREDADDLIQKARPSTESRTLPVLWPTGRPGGRPWGPCHPRSARCSSCATTKT